jgi:hypothetical protein
MDKTTRAEMIAALVTDKYSGFKEGDEAILEAASDARLEEFRTAGESHKATSGTINRLETSVTNTQARLKVAEERLKVAEQPLTAEDFIQRAPAEIKTLLDARKAEDDAIKASLISQLKDLGANTEAELKVKTIPELQTLAKYARIETPDYSGRGLPRESRNAESNDSFEPPNPYEAGIKALQGSQRVN